MQRKHAHLITLSRSMREGRQELQYHILGVLALQCPMQGELAKEVIPLSRSNLTGGA